MSRRTIRLAVAGGAVAASVLAGGTAFAADGDGTYVPQQPPNTENPGGSDFPGGGIGDNGGGTGGNNGGVSFTSNGGALTGGGGASTSDTGNGTGNGSNLPFTGFELATALTLGVGAIGAGSIVVVASRRKRDTSAIA